MTNSVVPPGFVQLPVEAFPSYLIGFPMHVAITVRPDRPGLTFKNLPNPTYDCLEGAIGIVCKDSSGTLRGVVRPNPVVEQDLGASVFTLRNGQERRFLVDLSDLLPWASIGAGTFQWQLTYAALSVETTSLPFQVELRSATPSERDALSVLVPSPASVGSFGAWARVIPGDSAERAALSGPFLLTDPLRYERVTRYLLCGDDSLSKIDPQILSVLSGPYSAEAELMAAELAWARGDGAAFSALSASIRSNTPGLIHRLDAISEGTSELARAEEERNKRRSLGP